MYQQGIRHQLHQPPIALLTLPPQDERALALVGHGADDQPGEREQTDERLDLQPLGGHDGAAVDQPHGAEREHGVGECRHPSSVNQRDPSEGEEADREGEETDARFELGGDDQRERDAQQLEDDCDRPPRAQPAELLEEGVAADAREPVRADDHRRGKGDHGDHVADPEGTEQPQPLGVQDAERSECVNGVERRGRRAGHHEDRTEPRGIGGPREGEFEASREQDARRDPVDHLERRRYQHDAPERRGRAGKPEQNGARRRNDWKECAPAPQDAGGGEQRGRRIPGAHAGGELEHRSRAREEDPAEEQPAGDAHVPAGSACAGKLVGVVGGHVHGLQLVAAIGARLRRTGVHAVQWSVSGSNR